MERREETGVCSSDAPAIAPRGARGAAWLVGTPLYVWQVVEALERDGSIAEVAARLGISERQVRLALEYHDRDRAGADTARAAG